MALRRHRDLKLDRLRRLTGVRDPARLVELGRVVDDVLEAAAGRPLLVDRFGVSHAVVLVRGSVYRPATQTLHVAGEAFVTQPNESVLSLDAVALVTTPSAGAHLAGLLRRRLDDRRFAGRPAAASSVTSPPLSGEFHRALAAGDP